MPEISFQRYPLCAVTRIFTEQGTYDFEAVSVQYGLWKYFIFNSALGFQEV
jgi:hypothetical protein